MKNPTTRLALLLIILLTAIPCFAGARGGQPNVLWIVTDDQRADFIRAFNRAVNRQDSSPLGYVESPNADQLAREGILFTKAITNSPVCAPSRAAMHTGRYPFRTGHYAFEMTHQTSDFVKPVISEVMRDHGYSTASLGKHDHYIYKWGPGQGIVAKFMPHKQSVSNAAILVSSEKSLVPAGGVYEDFIEFVDFAPTFMTAAGVDVTQPEFDYLDGFPLLDVLGEKRPKRDYVLGEINVISGPRAYLHTDRFRFSMRTRPFSNLVRANQMGKNLQWALNAPPEKVEMALYDLKTDPLERNNLAYQPGHEGLASWFRDKLGRIVLGDGRIECDWSQENAYVLGNFAVGADDKKANIPANLIP